ncbi:uncharacterized protein LOC126838424 isoform X2 [Adelges cooleyi]|nr:uncharacterized protein LOC126838424 isoform X2 [Adelges cooleyi]
MDDEKIKMKLKFLPYNYQRMCTKNQLGTNVKNHLKACTEDARNTLLKQIYNDCIRLSNGSIDDTDKMYNQLMCSEPMVSLNREQIEKSVTVTVKKRKLEKKEIRKMKNKKHLFSLLESLFGPEHLYADEGLLNVYDNCLLSMKLTSEDKNKRSSLSNRSSTPLESLDPYNNTLDLLSDLQNDPTDDEGEPRTLQINKEEKVHRERKPSKKKRISTGTTFKSSSEQAKSTLVNVKKSKSPEVIVTKKKSNYNSKINESTNEKKPQMFSRVITSVVNLKKCHKQTFIQFNLKREVKEEKRGDSSKIPSICLTRTEGNTYSIKPHTALPETESNIGKNVASPDSGISVSEDGPMQYNTIYPQDMEKLNEMEVVVNSNFVLKTESLINVLAGLLQEEVVLYNYGFVPHPCSGATKNPSTTWETSKSKSVCKLIAKLIDEFNRKKYNMIYLSSCLVRIFHKIIQDQDIKFHIIRDRFKMFCRVITKFVKSINKPFAKRWLKDKHYIIFLEICDYIILDEKSMISQLRFQEENCKITHYINLAFKYFENASVGCYDVDVSSINVVQDCLSPSDEDSSCMDDKKPALPVISVRPEFGISNFAVENYNVLSSVLHLLPQVNSAQPVDNKQPATTTYSRCMEFTTCKKISEWTCMCEKATYCSQKCQANHWPIHKNECSLRTTIT